MVRISDSRRLILFRGADPLLSFLAKLRSK
jgi:hypothetical protein